MKPDDALRDQAAIATNSNRGTLARLTPATFPGSAAADQTLMLTPRSSLVRSRRALLVAGRVALVLVGACPVLDLSHAASLDPAGVSVIPHGQSDAMRYRREPDPELGVRVQVFLENTTSEPLLLAATMPVKFNDKTAEQLLAAGSWTWHDTPSAWPGADVTLPPGALTVWSFNTKGPGWKVGTPVDVGLSCPGRAPERIALALEPPQAWLSAVTFLSTTGSVFPDTLIVHVANESSSPLRLQSARLWLPESNAHWRTLLPQPALTNLSGFPGTGIIPPGDRGGARITTGTLPLTYTAIELRVADPAGRTSSLWAHLRVKREAFDISGGWVASGLGGSNTLRCVPYLKTLRRLHVNTGMHDLVPGYTDDPGLYDRYPLKYMNRCQPIDRFDSDAVLPRIHAVEFLGEPQFGGGRPVPPMDVWRAFVPYRSTRLPTSVTHSEERIWRYYAGLSDFPHYDAYRVSAPAADAWNRYDRWGGKSIRWGAPLETIGDMTRSLRDLSRPVPIAYWSQGAHEGWERYGGRPRTSPTPDELRLQAYHALSSRITSLYWFNLSLKSLVKFRDLIEPITLLGREMKLLEPFMLEGDAYRYARLKRADGALDWDLASVCGPRAALLFALDLDYTPDPSEKVFRFGGPRSAHYSFALPAYLHHVTDLFRIDAEGVHEVRWKPTATGVEIEDLASRVAVYVATPEQALRTQLETTRQELVKDETALGFDPGRNDSDFEVLSHLLR